VVRGLLALLGTTILWSSSFPVIKIVVSSIPSLSYAWARSFIASMALLPYVIYAYRAKLVHNDVVLGGLVTGVAYALGLWLQGWGTAYTTASNSAFITGLNAVFVHAYVAIVSRSYSVSLGAELLIAMLGLYLLTLPRGGFGFGDALVLLSAVAWAAQVVLVSKYGGRNPLLFTFFEVIPALSFSLHDVVCGLPPLDVTSMLGLVYLGLACSVAAFALQAYGQKYVRPEIAALVFLLEPALAPVFAWIVLGESMMHLQIVGGALIVLSIALASREQLS